MRLLLVCCYTYMAMLSHIDFIVGRHFNVYSSVAFVLSHVRWLLRMQYSRCPNIVCGCSLFYEYFFMSFVTLVSGLSNISLSPSTTMFLHSDTRSVSTDHSTCPNHFSLPHLKLPDTHYRDLVYHMNNRTGQHIPTLHRLHATAPCNHLHGYVGRHVSRSLLSNSNSLLRSFSLCFTPLRLLWTHFMTHTTWPLTRGYACTLHNFILPKFAVFFHFQASFPQRSFLWRLLLILVNEVKSSTY
jgi:hypothetical protein